MKQDDVLIELGCEELPANGLAKLAHAFGEQCHQWLEKNNVKHGAWRWFATPRRLAVLIDGVAAQQPEQTINRKGPAIANAYDADGNPTPAAMGFARSCGVDIKDLNTEETPKGTWLTYTETKPGAAIDTLLPTMLTDVIKTLPLPKPMRWGTHKQAFLRPVHWLMVLYGEQVIPAELFDLTASNQTYGHRFHHPDAITIKRPHEYAGVLAQQGFVNADHVERQTQIKQQVEAIAKDLNGSAVIEQSLLDEVTGLVEWPVALCGEIPEAFLQLPAEVLITALRTHQKCFVIKGSDGKLLPRFVTISNLQSTQPEQVIIGNQRVVNARLNDAKFFYETDLKTALDTRLEQLKPITFQAQLGSVYDKATRIAQLANMIARQLNVDPEQATRAALLAKCDLVTDMVGEFPELQGIMGDYYARAQNEPAEIALAIQQHYWPRFAGDELPQNHLACCVALADKVDSLVGLFGVNKKPTGTKDPFGLRRAALGIVRIAIEKALPLDLRDVLQAAVAAYPRLENQHVVDEVLQFIYERIRAWYGEQAIAAEIIQAVLMCQPTSLIDIDKRIHAVQAFQQLPEAIALAAAHKRVHNILKKAEASKINGVDVSLLQAPAEIALAEQLNQQQTRVAPMYEQGDYATMLQTLASLRPTVDSFFDDVMVLVDDAALRANRLALLKQLQQLFGQVADISCLAAQLK